MLRPSFLSSRKRYGKYELFLTGDADLGDHRWRQEFPEARLCALLNSYNRDVLSKMLDDNWSIATHLFTAQLHILCQQDQSLPRRRSSTCQIWRFPTLAMTKEPTTPSTSQKRSSLKNIIRNLSSSVTGLPFFNLSWSVWAGYTMTGISIAISMEIHRLYSSWISKTRSSWSVSNMKTAFKNGRELPNTCLRKAW